MKPVPLFFNTTEPCRPDMHYMLPPANRLVGARLDRYISHQLYWVLHAPRQTGKTTFLQSWMKEINEGDEAISCYVSIERCQMFPRAEKVISSFDPDMTSTNDFLLALDLGLVTKENGTPVIANPIYREVIARILTQVIQDAIPAPEFKWKNNDGTLDMYQRVVNRGGQVESGQ